MYIYQADVYCDDCAEVIKEGLDTAGKRPADPEDEATFDSDEYPKGPYEDEQTRADSPSHCAHCHEFLENPLTKEGYEYVLEKMLDSDEKNAAFVPCQVLPTAVRQWAEFYDLMAFWDEPTFDRFDICEAFYCYAVSYHRGQWSAEYAIFGRLDRMQFKAGLRADKPLELSDNAKAIYGRLVMGESKVRA